MKRWAIRLDGVTIGVREAEDEEAAVLDFLNSTPGWEATQPWAGPMTLSVCDEADTLPPKETDGPPFD